MVAPVVPAQLEGVGVLPARALIAVALEVTLFRAMQILLGLQRALVMGLLVETKNELHIHN